MSIFIVPAFMKVALCVNDYGVTRVAMIGNSFRQHLHAVKRYQGRLRADLKPLTVLQLVRL